MPIQGQIKGKTVDARLWVPAHEIESSALDQIRNVASLPDVVGVSIMPDVHTGSGATIGSVIVTKNTIAPALTGVDIGCGMEAVRTSLDGDSIRERVLRKIHDGIRLLIPVGFNSNEKLSKKVRQNELWDQFSNLTPAVKDYLSKAQYQLGTLGGGNHFIEMSVDEEGKLWIMLHSGSRRIGKEIADAHIAATKNLEHNKSGLPDKALGYFIAGTPEFDSYMHDVLWAQQYAAANRARMLEIVMEWVEEVFPSVEYDDKISCHHNYVEVVHDWQSPTYYITRKGAIRAKEGELGIIPGAMGARSFIVRGLGNKDSFKSAPHGAGRKMSRSKAKKKYRLQDLEATMNGIVCSIDKHTIDEIRYSYKDIDKVMEYSSDLAEPIHELSQVLNIKG